MGVSHLPPTHVLESHPLCPILGIQWRGGACCFSCSGPFQTCWGTVWQAEPRTLPGPGPWALCPVTVFPHVAKGTLQMGFD